ncbi:unnamed protein product, partial [Protopolystoma xenopodis]
YSPPSPQASFRQSNYNHYSAYHNQNFPSQTFSSSDSRDIDQQGSSANLVTGLLGTLSSACNSPTSAGRGRPPDETPTRLNLIPGTAVPRLVGTSRIISTSASQSVCDGSADLALERSKMPYLPTHQPPTSSSSFSSSSLSTSVTSPDQQLQDQHYLSQPLQQQGQLSHYQSRSHSPQSLQQHTRHHLPQLPYHSPTQMGTATSPSMNSKQLHCSHISQSHTSPYQSQNQQQQQHHPHINLHQQLPLSPGPQRRFIDGILPAQQSRLMRTDYESGQSSPSPAGSATPVPTPRRESLLMGSCQTSSTAITCALGGVQQHQYQQNSLKSDGAQTMAFARRAQGPGGSEEPQSAGMESLSAGNKTVSDVEMEQ